MRKGVYSGLT